MKTLLSNSKSKLVAGLLASSIFVGNASAFALLPPQLIDIIANQIANIADISEQIATTTNTANQVQNSLKQLENEAKNLESLSPSQLADYNRYIDELGSIMSTTNGMAYSLANVETKFDENFPSYSSTLDNILGGSMAQRRDKFASEYKKLTDVNRGTAIGTLKNLAKTGKYLDDDKVTLDRLKSNSDSATGNLQAMQAASAIASHQTETLKNLHRTMLSQQSLMVANQQKVEAEQARQQAYLLKLKTDAQKPTRGDEPVRKTW
jgi:type IV secretion system protein TrbJ